MELKWIEDFLSLVETGSFSRSAELRHVTQPAFSRRIRALESWIGAYLIDRSSSPANLTPAGRVFRVEAQEILARVSGLRSVVHGKPTSCSEMVELTLPHTFSSAVFSKWLSEVERCLADHDCGLTTASVPDRDISRADGYHGLLMCYHHTDCPDGIDSTCFESVTLGREMIRPYVRTVRGRRPLFEFPGRRDAPLPFLSYMQNSYMYRVTGSILNQAPACLIKRHQADTIERLKSMVMEGRGVAFLPENIMGEELRKRYVTVAGDERWQIELDVRVYRRRDSTSPGVRRLWSRLMNVGSFFAGSDTEYRTNVAN